MNWNRPKKFLKKTVMLLSFFSLISSLIAFTVFFQWVNNPNKISEIDKKIPNYYENRINKIHTQAVNAKKDDVKFQQYENLLKELNGASSLHKFYDLVNESYTNIIDYFIKNGDLDKALQNVKNWKENYPYEFLAKYKYADVLMLKDPILGLIYYDNLYKKYNDVFVLKSKYVKSLLDAGSFNKALKISRDSSLKIKKNIKPSFMFYYIEKNKRFNKDEKQMVKAFDEDLGNYSVILEKKFKHLKGIRFDFDNISVNTKIQNFSFSINVNNTILQNVKIKSLNHIKKVANGFLTTGSDPFLVLDLPKIDSKYSGMILFDVTFKLIEIENRSINHITYHKDWKISYSQKNNFSNVKPIEINLFDSGDSFLININPPYKNDYFFKIDFPGFKDMNICEFDFTNLKIIQTHDFQQKNDKCYQVHADKPYVIFKPLHMNLDKDLILTFKIRSSK